MSVYHFSEGAFELPPSWLDQSVHMLVRGGGAPATGPTLVINREVMSAPFAEQVAANISSMRRTLPRFKLIEERHLVVGGLPAISIEFSWKRDSAAVTQKVIFVAYTGVMMHFTLSGGLGSWEDARGELERIVASIRFRAPESLA